MIEAMTLLTLLNGLRAQNPNFRIESYEDICVNGLSPDGVYLSLVIKDNQFMLNFYHCKDKETFSGYLSANGFESCKYTRTGDKQVHGPSGGLYYPYVEELEGEEAIEKFMVAFDAAGG